LTLKKVDADSPHFEPEMGLVSRRWKNRGCPIPHSVQSRSFPRSIALHITVTSFPYRACIEQA
jgi:hypothetical protein